MSGVHFVNQNSNENSNRSSNRNQRRRSNGRNGNPRNYNGQNGNPGGNSRSNNGGSSNSNYGGNYQINPNGGNRTNRRDDYNGGSQENGGNSSKGNHYGRCRKCNMRGHSLRDCRANGSFCYNCKKVTNHFAKNCPEREAGKPSPKVKGEKKPSNLMVRGDENSEFNSKFYYPIDCFNSSGKCFTAAVLTVHFIVDSGASYHFTNERRILSKVRKLSRPTIIDCAKKGQESALSINELGEFHTYTALGKPITFTNVLYSPDVSENLLSLRQLVEQGAYFDGNAQQFYIRDGNTGDVIIRAQFRSPFWATDLRIRNPREVAMLTNADDGGPSPTSPTIRENLGRLWHTRLAHASLGYLEVYKTKMAVLKNVTFGKDIMDCQSCALAKVHRNPSKKKRQRSKIVLQRIHSDVMGPITPLSFPGKRRYVITFVDDFSRFAMVFVMCNKSDAADCFRQYLDDMRRMIGKDTKVRYLRTDGGTEYAGEMGRLLKQEKIEIEVAEPDTPTHNGVAERINRTLREKTTAMLSDSGLPTVLWDHAISQAVYVYNRTPHKSNGFKSPYEVFNGETPDISFLRRFGCLAIVRKTRDEFEKFDERGRRGIVLNNTISGYRIMLPSKRITESKDVDFIENITYGVLKKSKDTLFNFDFDNTAIAWQNDTAERDTADENLNLDDSSMVSGKRYDDRSNPVASTSAQTQNDGWVTQPQNDNWDDYDIVNVEEIVIFDDSSNDTFLAFDRIIALRACLLEDEKDPLTYAEALARTDREYWIKAMEDEMASLERNDAWDLVEPPKGVNIIDSRWVFCRKSNETDSSVRYKARLVIRGCKDKEVYDIGDVYSPVASKHIE